MKESAEMQKYFERMQEQLMREYSLAEEARKLGYDPEQKVDIPVAKNMAERVEGLISAVAPQIANFGVSKRIQELETQYKPLAWEVALIIALEVAEEKFCRFKDKKEAMEVGIRTGFAYHTIGIVSAPLEGFTGLRIKKRKDGKEYLAPCFSGPVRGAGGTAAAFCLMIVDYIRIKSGYSEYDPDEKEINRYVTELYDYHERITNLQYKPSPEEIKFLIKNIPVEIDGDPTEDIEVSNYKDLPRVDTDRIRGGVCLVASMVALKAPKLLKEMDKLKPFGVDWSFLREFLSIQKAMKSGKREKSTKLTPDYTYISDLVAGRPVLTYPLSKGGFRLRYGRTRMSGYSAAAINPLTMAVLGNYIATGTQLKMERPGKAAAITPCDSIEGPVIKLKNGDVVKPESYGELKQMIPEIEEILFLGDMLISYGDFFDRAHHLVPAGYCEEWHIKELEKAAAAFFGRMDYEKLSELLEMPADAIKHIVENPMKTIPSPETAIKIAEKLNVPLHPRFTYHWEELNKEELKEFIEWFRKAAKEEGDGRTRKIILPAGKEKRHLELLGIPHKSATNTYVVIEKDEAAILARFFLSATNENTDEIIERSETNTEAISQITGIMQRDKAGTFIGARMGRPEKAKMRKLTGSPHGIFPIGEEGGRLRSVQAALEKGKVKAEFSVFHCDNCERSTIYPVCEICDKKAERNYVCGTCGLIKEKECRHGPAKESREQFLDIRHYYEHALKKIGGVAPELVKGIRGTSSKNHIPENLIKAVLRAKYRVAVNKDGTIRYDMTELPITHFRPKEVGTSVEKLAELGYERDILGNKLENEEQTLEIFPQDIILPANPESTDESADEILFRISGFVDELLTCLYGKKPFYNLKDKTGLIGQLVIGLAPHISAGMVGRIIGFSKTQCFLAHPLYHAAMRRDADGDEACVILVMDALLNFSRQYLPDTRGAKTMDAPLVLTAKLVPAEVDDMAHRLDVGWSYPLELYEAALQHKMPEEVKIELLGQRLNTPAQYEGTGFTHTLSSINTGVVCSAYKTLPSMEDKLNGQMVLAERIRAVEAQDVARLVIEKHFIKDIKGNLRKFSTQQFRCITCNKKFRRPVLMGKCDSCGGRIIFTVSEGTVTKYSDMANNLAIKYNVPEYVQQTLMLTRRRIEEVFGKESEKQAELESWMAS